MRGECRRARLRDAAPHHLRIDAQVRIPSSALPAGTRPCHHKNEGEFCDVLPNDVKPMVAGVRAEAGKSNAMLAHQAMRIPYAIQVFFMGLMLMSVISAVRAKVSAVITTEATSSGCKRCCG